MSMCVFCREVGGSHRTVYAAFVGSASSVCSQFFNVVCHVTPMGCHCHSVGVVTAQCLCVVVIPFPPGSSSLLFSLCAILVRLLLLQRLKVPWSHSHSPNPPPCEHRSSDPEKNLTAGLGNSECSLGRSHRHQIAE